jgi:hypothetical protein
MGMGPEVVGRMSLWQFMAALDGYGRANGWKKTGNTAGSMSDQRLAELGIEGFK